MQNVSKEVTPSTEVTDADKDESTLAAQPQDPNTDDIGDDSPKPSKPSKRHNKSTDKTK